MRLKPDPTESRPWWLKGLLIFGVWTLLGLFDASHSYFAYQAKGDPVAWWNVLFMGLALWYGWALMAQGVFFLGDRFPPEERPRLRNLAVHAVAGVGCALLKVLLDYPIIEMFYCPDPGLMSLGQFFAIALPSQFHKYVLFYWAILGIQRAWCYYRRYRERELQTAKLQSLLSAAQLQVLRMQLHPHFLFNTLNSISALVHSDVKLADRMIARLGDLLRLSLENAGRQEVPLREEIDFLQTYLEIEQARLGPRLRLHYHIDAEALDVPVPYLMLQPLAENAVKHAIAPRRDGGVLEIHARLEADGLVLEVIDDGPGYNPAPTNGRQGIGLSNTRARLSQMFGDRHQFEMIRPESGGLCIRIRLPVRPPPLDSDATDWKPELLPGLRRLAVETPDRADAS